MQQIEFKRGRACSIKTISLYYFLDLKMEFALSMSLPIFFCIYVSGSTAGALFLLMHLESKHDATALVLPQTVQFVQGWDSRSHSTGITLVRILQQSCLKAIK